MPDRRQTEDALYAVPHGALRVRWSEDGKTGEVHDQIDTMAVGGRLLEAMNERRPIDLDGRQVHVVYVGFRGGVFFRDHGETVPAITAQFVLVRPTDAGSTPTR